MRLKIVAEVLFNESINRLLNPSTIMEKFSGVISDFEFDYEYGCLLNSIESD
ncbi:hypothetical protein NE848_08285 [Gramella jeungdoensis]|uniref:Uncharacterized protein n=1 Tax=Gramella jeungdoensis TaxID=708091 RepID=A0ABT0Z0Y6_9FLAO|nr:hypothetical protein [Gramella jeungdoensis]MCM8569374.1 hypothetical protein [Gramella jeungdoensis]